MAKQKEGWAKLTRILKAEIDQERIKADRGTTWRPLEAGGRSRNAVKITDDRRIDSLLVVNLA